MILMYFISKEVVEIYNILKCDFFSKNIFLNPIQSWYNNVKNSYTLDVSIDL